MFIRLTHAATENVVALKAEYITSLHRVSGRGTEFTMISMSSGAKDGSEILVREAFDDVLALLEVAGQKVLFNDDIPNLTHGTT